MKDVSDFDSGKKLFFEGHYAEAEAVFSQLLREDQEDAEKSNIWNALGAIHFKQGHWSHALECFNQAVTLNSCNSKAIDNIQNLLAKHPEYANLPVKEIYQADMAYYSKKICNFCGTCPSQDSWLLFRCNYCGGHFCSDHRLPPYHGCSNIKQWKARPPPGLNIRYQQNGSVLSMDGVSEKQDFSSGEEFRFHQYYVPNHNPNEKYHDKSRKGLYIALIIAIILFAIFQFSHLLL